MQDTFLAVIRAAQQYRPRALVRTYLYGIAMNLLAAERRKQSKDSTLDVIATEPATGNTPEPVLWIRKALAQLDDSDREILMLREYEQLSYREIANLMKLPVNTVRSRLFRARAALKDRLAPKSELNQASVMSDVQPAATLGRAEGEAI
jgi:RNA polymerase sigma-70 factor (ECF subfamily)